MNLLILFLSDCNLHVYVYVNQNFQFTSFYTDVVICLGPQGRYIKLEVQKTGFLAGHCIFRHTYRVKYKRRRNECSDL